MQSFVIFRRAGFIYQYYEGLEQDLEGELNITEEIINNNVIQQVSHGICQDYFEFREVKLNIYLCTSDIMS